MKIESLEVGILRCNCYLLEINKHLLVIDPGDDIENIIKKIDKRYVDGIIITHHHSDHDGVSLELADKYNVKISDMNNLSEGINKINDFIFEVIYTPGHRIDAITIYFRKEKVMFCGDFIFKDTIGRCDLPTGNIKEMFKSIEKIKKYDDDITIYPGHGEKTTLGYEKKNSIYFEEH